LHPFLSRGLLFSTILMGVIQKQSIRSSVFIMAGFILGAFNILIIAPKVLTPSQLGLTRVITDAGITLATLCTLGSLPIIYKFFPFYKSYLPPRKNDLPFLSLTVCALGFVIMCVAGYAARDIIVQKFSERSPLFVQYSWTVYPFSFFILAYMWLEGWSWAFKKGVQSNALRETVPRILFTVGLLLLAFRVISLPLFLLLFSLSYLLPAIILFFVLWRTGELHLYTGISTLTRRLKSKMINFGLFLFGAQFLNLLSRTADTFIITSKAERGLVDTAVFTIATYVVTIMEIPQRSINAITIPVLAESWRNKDMNNITHIYTRSVTNMLVIGLVVFLLTLLNVHNFAIFLGKDFTGIESVVFIMGIGKLIDLGTGANGQIISTSNYWKVDFTTNVIYTLVALPLNYLLISKYGLMGAAYSTLISLTFYNAMRYGFLWYKFGLQPYTWKHLVVILLAFAVAFAVWNIPRIDSVVFDTMLRTVVFCGLFFPALYFTRISPDANGAVLKYARKLRGFFK